MERPVGESPLDRRGLVVAIDGPSGSGKSTVARTLAAQLSLRYLDTGAMYRALTWLALRDPASLDDQASLARLAASADLVVATDPGNPTVSADGTDVTQAIRGRDVTQAVSVVSAIPEVRSAMVERQRRLIGHGGIVVEGRDIGSTVVPDAPVKVFLTADAQVRAGRRAAQDGRAAPTSGSGPAGAEEPAASAPSSPDDVLRAEADLRRRDAADSSRAASPLAMAPDAVEIDSSALDVAEVVRVIAARVARLEERAG